MLNWSEWELCFSVIYWEKRWLLRNYFHFSSQIKNSQNEPLILVVWAWGLWNSLSLRKSIKVQATKRTPNNLFCLFPIWDNFVWYRFWQVLENPEIVTAWKLRSEWNVALAERVRGGEWEAPLFSVVVLNPIWSVRSCSPLLGHTVWSAEHHSWHDLASGRGQWLFPGRRHGGLFLAPVLFNLSCWAEGDTGSVTICSPVQNIFSPVQFLPILLICGLTSDQNKSSSPGYRVANFTRNRGPESAGPQLTILCLFCFFFVAV